MMANGGGDLWLLMTVFGVIVLGLAMAYAIVRNRGMTRKKKQVNERATEDLYEAEQKNPANQS